MFKKVEKPDYGSRHTIGTMFTRIDGKTYDISEFAARHPGGAELALLAAGRDATTLFYSYHRCADRRICPVPARYSSDDSILFVCFFAADCLDFCSTGLCSHACVCVY
jgi:predicted heme/steroid binding protein